MTVQQVDATSTVDLPASMHAWVLHGKEDMRLEQRVVPRPAAREVLIKVGSVGVCGSDKHFYFEGKASSDVIDSAVVLGHEFGGTIVAVGSEVHPTRMGSRVSVEPLVPDWRSREARTGHYNVDPSQKFFGVPGLDGALQQYLVVPDDNAFDIPPSVSDDAAAMVETIAVALNGVKKARVTLGDRVLIAGGGPVGLFVAQLCALAGAAETVVVEPQQSRRFTAGSLGCSTASDLSEAGGGYDAFVDCTGVAAVRHDGCLTVRPGKQVVFIGVGADNASVPMRAVIEREVNIVGVMRYAFAWPTVIEMLADRRIDADLLVSRRLGFAHALDAWTQPLATEVKTMIRVDES